MFIHYHKTQVQAVKPVKWNTCCSEANGVFTFTNESFLQSGNTNIQKLLQMRLALQVFHKYRLKTVMSVINTVRTIQHRVFTWANISMLSAVCFQERDLQTNDICPENNHTVTWAICFQYVESLFGVPTENSQPSKVCYVRGFVNPIDQGCLVILISDNERLKRLQSMHEKPIAVETRQSRYRGAPCAMSARQN